MDRLKRFALKKVTDGLDKVLEAKAHFDKREEKKKMQKDLIKLKEAISNKMFYSETKKNSEEIYEDLQKIFTMEHKKHLDHLDKKTLQELMSKYL